VLARALREQLVGHRHRFVRGVVRAGLRGLVTARISGLIAVGFLDTFYSSGVSTSGIGSLYLDMQLIYVPTVLSRLTLGYRQDAVNSVISNFYYDYSAYASFVQQLAGRVSVDLSARFSHLDYQGALFDTTHPRSDNVLVLGATIDYFLRSWAYLGLGYSLTSDFTDYLLPQADVMGMASAGLPVSYNKQQVFARLGITY